MFFARLCVPLSGKTFTLLSAFIFCSFSAFAQMLAYQHPIPYDPATYVCYRTNAPVIIDGKLDEADWQQAAWTADFVDIEGELKPLPPLRTRAKMMWDDTYFYFAARLDEPHIWATLTERDAIMYKNDDFEIFIDPDANGIQYYEFEMNAHNAIWDLFMLQPYRSGRGQKYMMEWTIEGIKTAVHIEGTLNNPNDEDQYWSVEVAMPWEVLRSFAPHGQMPKDGDQWRVNFSRVDWWVDIKDGEYHKRKNLKTGKVPAFPQENWVWSPSGKISMHEPETWGYVQFSTAKVGRRQLAFRRKPDEQIKWALWQLYHLQHQHFQRFGAYAQNMEQFILPEVTINSYFFKPALQATERLFEFSAASLERGKTWYINQSGEIWKE